MNNLTISKQHVLSAYRSESLEGKKVLEALFGNTVFQPITDRVKTFADACAVVGTTEQAVLALSQTTDGQAYEKLKVVAQALNEGWQPDWKNGNKYKWYPVFDMSGDRLVFYGAYFWYLRSAVGSRLCFETEEKAAYAGKQFLDLFETLFVIQ